MSWLARAMLAAAVGLALVGSCSTSRAEDADPRDPDDGVWLDRGDAAEADRAVAVVPGLREQVRRLERALELQRAIDVRLHRLLLLGAQEVAAECRMKVRAQQDAQRLARGRNEEARRRVADVREARAIGGATSAGLACTFFAPGIGTAVCAAVGALVGYASTPSASDVAPVDPDPPADAVAACPVPPVPPGPADGPADPGRASEVDPRQQVPALGVVPPRPSQ